MIGARTLEVTNRATVVGLKERSEFHLNKINLLPNSYQVKVNKIAVKDNSPIRKDDLN
jgi:hypothetical protein